MLETCKHNLFRNWFVKWRHLFWTKELVEDLLLDKRRWIWRTSAIQRLRVFTNKDKRVEFDSSKAKTRQMTSRRLFKILFTIYDKKTDKRKTSKRPDLIQNSGSNLLCNPEVDFTSDKSFAATFLPQPTLQYTLLSFAEK